MAGTTRTQTVLDRLREMLLNGRLKPGARLQKEMLAQLLNVSRTPVHDALAALTAEGLVSYAPRSGFTLKDFDIADVLAAFDVRIVLEGLACRLLAQKPLSPSVSEILSSHLREGASLLAAPSWNPDTQRQWAALNMAFHEEILIATDNDYLIGAVRQVRSVANVYDKLRDRNTGELHRPFTDEQRKHSQLEHEKIFEALSQGQILRAGALMEEHVFQNREAMRINHEDICQCGS